MLTIGGPVDIMDSHGRSPFGKASIIKRIPMFISMTAKDMLGAI